MGEGKDEGGFLNCSRFTLHSSRYFQDRTALTLPEFKVEKIAAFCIRNE